MIGRRRLITIHIYIYIYITIHIYIYIYIYVGDVEHRLLVPEGGRCSRPKTGCMYVCVFVCYNYLYGYVCYVTCVCYVILFCVDSLIVTFVALLLCAYLCISVFSFLKAGRSTARARVRRMDHTRHILPPSEMDLGLCWAVFAGLEGKY